MAFIGVVLSGGQSKRMGQDKAQLSALGKTMLNRTREVLLQAGAVEVVVSRNAGMTGEIADIYPACGPLSGIHAVCSQLPNQNLLFVPVDLPLLSKTELQRLAKAGSENQCLTRFTGHNLPLFVKNTESFRKAITCQLVHEKQYSVGHFCRQFPLAEITSQETQTLFNSNTQSQWMFALDLLDISRNPRTANPSTANSSTANSSTANPTLPNYRAVNSVCRGIS
ncbi:MAG: molybdenum cofactor guanylyltransferase [Aestuariibacter sp.]